MISSIDSYRKLGKYFDNRKLSYHTYQVRKERTYRVVIKGLYHSTPPEDNKSELIAQGHGVRNICNVRSRFTKEPRQCSMLISIQILKTRKF
ncbi:Nucleic-acid-binding protein from transposon X-element [Lucilia cuprina]|nr:Nucleic-acid-binding protein from transposon X-element [Lucilia cuprina]